MGLTLIVWRCRLREQACGITLPLGRLHCSGSRRWSLRLCLRLLIDGVMKIVFPRLLRSSLGLSHLVHWQEWASSICNTSSTTSSTLPRTSRWQSLSVWMAASIVHEEVSSVRNERGICIPLLLVFFMLTPLSLYRRYVASIWYGRSSGSGSILIHAFKVDHVIPRLRLVGDLEPIHHRFCISHRLEARLRL